MSRILVLGGFGMLGHQLTTVLSWQHEVTATVRGDAKNELTRRLAPASFIANVDLTRVEQIQSLFERESWDVVINAAGVIKHRVDQDGVSNAIALNAWLPRMLASLCMRTDARFIHFSTDCVFTGTRHSERGRWGYREEDIPDARDTYGLSKLLGEPDTANSLCIRTSLVGRELRGHHGLVDWYLASAEEQVPGFTQALFNGLTTAAAAQLVAFVIEKHPGLTGLWHVGSQAVSKYELLRGIHQRVPNSPRVVPSDEFFCDRRLDSEMFQARTGWQAPTWDSMIEDLTGEVT
ncbi:dTDP-4-dehydrorhamnose reductase family protein [Parahaliea aestuarii]|uniref:dTDP-4-dehydrorhamnose reductase n=1 Tax=Parahaliea aestuarii TaxID=1852021 RepID=A0A5C8ZLG1_9GAMM|nr:SDR family oxidoreductase [Parahaliea aestuarii]TXS89416.1 SDR family oxidoreductase [Parahaliea aestuarii]